jgi:hypothetical protein
VFVIFFLRVVFVIVGKGVGTEEYMLAWRYVCYCIEFVL